MHFLVSIILPYLLLYKYWAIFLVTLFAACAFPIPPGTLLMAASAFASQGYLSFFWVVASGSLGNIIGDSIGYLLARCYGKRVLRRIGFRKILDSDKYKSIETRVRRKPGFLIFISRFEVFSNLSVNLIAGMSQIPYSRYILFIIPGEIAQVTIYCAIGYFVGDNWNEISGIISKFLLLIVLVAALFIAIFWKKIWRWITRDVPVPPAETA